MAKVAVDDSSGCWNWIGAIDAKGYGRFGFRRRNALAYHVAYQLFVGAIPDDGLQFDHVCRNRACVNPEHLERVTPKENTRRGINWNALKTHCPLGHLYAGENLIVRADGSRGCRACRRRRTAAWGRRVRRERRLATSTR